jgi:hypothetical protein
VPQRVPLAQAGYAADGALVYVGYLSTGRKEGPAPAPSATPKQ